MEKLEQLNKIKELQERLESMYYHFMTIKHNYELGHHDFLVTDQWNSGIMFGSLSFDEKGNFLIFKAVVLGLSSQFIRVHKLIEMEINQ